MSRLSEPVREYARHINQLKFAADANYVGHQVSAAYLERWQRRLLLAAAAVGFIAAGSAATSTVPRTVVFVAAAVNTVLVAASTQVITPVRSTNHREDAASWLEASHETATMMMQIQTDAAITVDEVREMWEQAAQTVQRARRSERSTPSMRAMRLHEARRRGGRDLDLYSNRLFINVEEPESFRSPTLDGTSDVLPMFTGGEARRATRTASTEAGDA